MYRVEFSDNISQVVLEKIKNLTKKRKPKKKGKGKKGKKKKAWLMLCIIIYILCEKLLLFMYICINIYFRIFLFITEIYLIKVLLKFSKKILYTF